MLDKCVKLAKMVTNRPIRFLFMCNLCHVHESKKTFGKNLAKDSLYPLFLGGKNFSFSIDCSFVFSLIIFKKKWIHMQFDIFSQQAKFSQLKWKSRKTEQQKKTNHQSISFFHTCLNLFFCFMYLDFIAAVVAAKTIVIRPQVNTGKDYNNRAINEKFPGPKKNGRKTRKQNSKNLKERRKK